MSTPEEQARLLEENQRLRALIGGGSEPSRIITSEEAAALGIKGTSDDDPSGAELARRAHEAGAVIAPVELPNFDVTLHFVYRGEREQAEKLRDDLLYALLQMDGVQQPIDNAVAERVIGVPDGSA